MFKNIFFRTSLALFSTLSPVMGLAHSAQAESRAGSFSYYTIALSWSPTYCETRERRGYDQQCDSKRPYSFVLHGVWPQYNEGWPSYCRTNDNWVPNEVIEPMMDIMPSKKLVIHQWKKHGTCSGLAPKAFFDLSRELFNKIKIPARYITPTQPIVITPDEIESDFIKTNQGIKADMISIACSGQRQLREVRICFDRDKNFTHCGANENQRKLCSIDKIVMPPVRQ